MTNLYEEQDNLQYFSLKFVEFQDLLCRVALQYFAEKEEEGRRGPTEYSIIKNQMLIKVTKPTPDLEDKVHTILEMLWAKRTKKQLQQPAKSPGRSGPPARGQKRRHR